MEMTERELFEAVYRKCFPIAVGMQSDLFQIDGEEYARAKVYVAFKIWQATRATPADQEPIRWENLPCYLIDICEGQVISEEFLQRAISDMLAHPQYSGAKPFNLSQQFISAAQDGPDVMGFDETHLSPESFLDVDVIALTCNGEFDDSGGIYFSRKMWGFFVSEIRALASTKVKP